MMEKMDRKEIFDLFVQAFNNKDFRIVSGLNPCIVEYAGMRLNVYIKNLTPAQLSNNNPDVWRCQLPKRPIFDDFKTSSDIFLLLGYDASSDVYATWNPYWAKQRLNVGESVSMYSRYSIQQEASRTSTIIQHDLRTTGIVVVFPRLMLTHYIDHITDYFSEETPYEAIGSSLRKNKVNNTDIEPYNLFADCKNIESFKEYLAGLEIAGSTKSKYLTCVRLVFKRDLHTKYQAILSKCNHLSEFAKTIDEFCNTEEVAFLDRRGGNGRCGYIRASLKCYLNSLLEKYKNQSKTNDSKVHNIIEICSSEVASQIAQLMCKDEPLEMEAMQLLYDEIGDRYNQYMSISDWLHLLRNTNWEALLQERQ